MHEMVGSHALRRITDVAVTISTITMIVYCCCLLLRFFHRRNAIWHAIRLVATGSLHAMPKTHRCLTTDDTQLDWKEVDCRACCNYAFCAKSDHQAGLWPLQAAKTWCKWCATQVPTPEATAKMDVGDNCVTVSRTAASICIDCHSIVPFQQQAVVNSSCDDTARSGVLLGLWRPEALAACPCQ